MFKKNNKREARNIDVQNTTSAKRDVRKSCMCKRKKPLHVRATKLQHAKAFYPNSSPKPSTRRAKGL